MTRKEIKIIAIDLDGTLFNAKKEVSEKTVERLSVLAKKV